jgi:hypothetical protein
MTALLLENFKLIMLLLLIGSVIILSHLREPQLGKVLYSGGEREQGA